MSQTTKILAVDIGTGTQDILLFDPRLDVENAYKLVLPAPTMIINHRLRRATREGRPVLLSGLTMGGGPSAWAAEDHVRAGFPVYATPQAARTFNDDLDKVAETGIRVISEDEALRLPQDVLRVELRDFDFPAIWAAFDAFGVALDDLAAVAVAVFDHGAAPPENSDRQFRFEYLDRRIQAENRLSAFAYPASQIPPIMTRLQAVADSANNCPAPLIVMDTAPAAVLGATFDPRVAALPRKLIGNVGNFHTLAFRLGPEGIEGVFEHHTGLLDVPQLESLLLALADGSLKHEDVFDHHGHGALVYNQEPMPLDAPAGSLVITGPRRAMLRGSRLQPYFAVPFGDMMIAGCFGLLAAAADLMPNLRELVLHALTSAAGMSRPPWELSPFS
jgi:uncharacterized protein (DUF1786 family)